MVRPQLAARDEPLAATSLPQLPPVVQQLEVAGNNELKRQMAHRKLARRT
jgi:hypothetical protein